MTKQLFETNTNLSDKMHVDFGKQLRRNTHKLYLGLPFHIKLLLIKLSILFISIIIHKYILFVWN